MSFTIDELFHRPSVLFAVSHSGGKDSQSMLIEVLRHVPASRVLVIYADLGEVAWAGAKEHAEQQARDAGCHFRVAKAIWRDGTPKDFLGMVEQRFAQDPSVPSFPSKNQRRCTSELKTGPIQTVIRQFMREHGLYMVVDCLGLRSQESADRRARTPFVYENENLAPSGKPKHKLVAAGRRVWTWLPIHDKLVGWVFETIASANQEPHWAYAAGNERMSCVFCLFGKVSDLRNGVKHRPELFAKYDALERKTGYTLTMNKPLREIVGDAIAMAS